MNNRYEQTKPVKVHPIKEGRRVPLTQLMKRLNVLQYENKTPLDNSKIEPKAVTIPAKQHAGEPAEIIVNVGEHIDEQQLIARIPEGKMGANIHASISGMVTSIRNGSIKIVK